MLALAAPSVQAQPTSADARLAQTRADLHAAYDARDADALDRIRLDLDQMATAGIRPDLAHYYSALASLRLFALDPDAERYTDLAAASSEAALSLRPDFSDAHALRGMAYGRKIDGMISGMRYGGRSNDAMDRALALDPDNPRALVLRAISALYKPAIWGGGRDRAVEGFRRAIALYDARGPAAPSDPEPQWGRDEAHAWLGIALRDSGDIERARQQFARALALNPDSEWIRGELMPSLTAAAD
jgi:tetratricopeptide (TPR) repeat protein